VINLAGHQRMLSQRIAKSVERNDRAEVAHSLQPFDRAHRALRFGDESFGIVHRNSEIVNVMFDGIDEHFRSLTAAARAVIALPANEEIPEELIDQVATSEASFLPQMHAIVGQYETEAQTSLANLAIMKQSLLIANVLAVLGVGLFVLDPAARRLRVHWNSLRESESRFQLAVRGSRDAIFDWNLNTDKIYYTPIWAVMFNEPRFLDSKSPEPWYRLIAPHDLERFDRIVENMRSGLTDRIDEEFEMRTGDGRTVWVLCRAGCQMNDDGKAMRLAGAMVDVSAQHEDKQKLRDVAERDGLTGLANRTKFRDRVEFAVARSQGADGPAFAVLYFDFDGFKAVNDALGHTVGDELLQSIADRMRAELPETSVIARLGGDEFAVLLTELDKPSVTTLCDALLAELAKPHRLGTHEVVSTASIGIVMNDERYVDAEAVLRDADAAMYSAKSNGKAQARFFDIAMHECAVEQHRIETTLRSASIADTFEVTYQPIVLLESGDPDGFEALVRWPDRDGSPCSPDTFIPIAEETGVIVELGEWILHESAAALRDMDDAFGEYQLAMHVNVSKRQILHPGFLRMLEDVKRRFPALMGRLVLEITETAVMDTRANLVPRMEKMRELGFPLAMDDFGTGHSSLSCLHQFPLNKMKIDRSFIVGIEARREFSAVYHSIVALADNLNLRVVAEGIETPGQLAQMQGMGCPLGQGHLFGRGMSRSEAFAYLRDPTVGRPAA